MYTGLELKSCTYNKTSETGKIMFELAEKQNWKSKFLNLTSN